MKRIAIEQSKETPNFIGSWIMEPMSISDDLINYFELNHTKQKRGVTSKGIDKDAKNCVDISIQPNEMNLPGNEVFNSYFHGLFECYKDYITQWPFLETIADNLEIGKFNLQRYQKGEHFHKLHAERSNLNTLHRVLAWMTYLNDVDEGGSTYFSHYNLTIQPQKALTLIWPVEWTHAHRGDIVKTGSKYIITGWMSFP